MTLPKTDPLVKEILTSQSPNIISFFLDTENCEAIEYTYRAAAMRLTEDASIDSADKENLQSVIEEIAENEDDDLQEEARELLMSCAGDEELSEIAMDEDEEEDTRINAVEMMTDVDLLLDIAADAEDDDVRQAAKARIKELR